jgi:spermidine/putrescine-binding protein
MILALSSRDVSAGNMHSPEYLAAMRDNPSLAACVPEEDRAMVQVFWAIPAGAENRRLAEDAINVLFSRECQLGFARRGMATPILDVAKAVASEDPLWASLYPHTDEQLRSLRYYPYEAYARCWEELSDAWDRTVLAPG